MLTIISTNINNIIVHLRGLSMNKLCIVVVNLIIMHPLITVNMIPSLSSDEHTLHQC